MKKGIFITSAVFALVLISVAGYVLYQNWKINLNLTKTPPKAPINLIAKPLSSTEVMLTWTDKANNEDGFIIFRDGIRITEVQANSNQYIDSGRRPATNYRYEIKAYNLAGESSVVTYSIKTLNPPIVVWIDRIGVHDNGEDFLRDRDGGEVEVGVVITDGKTTAQIRLPKEGFYHLKEDETTDVKIQAFSTKEVGDYLRVAAIGYEDDGGSGEQLIYTVMDKVAKSYIGGPVSILLTLSGIDLSSIIGGIVGAESDWLGTHVATWESDSNWGVGSYLDVSAKTKNGDIGIRVWFRVSCPVYDYSLEKSLQ